MKRKQVAIGITAVIIAGCIGTGFMITNRLSKSHSYSVSEAEIKENTVQGHDGSYYYQNQEENLVASSEDDSVFYNNVLNAYLASKLSEEEANQLANTVNGKIVGCINGEINCLQIMVPDSDFEQLNHLSGILMESEDVLYASYDFPIGMRPSDSNPWEEPGDEHSDLNHDANTASPDGNDWWAESIGAYTAWNYVDHFPDSIADITVGVVDSEINENHEDFLDSNGQTKVAILGDQRGLYSLYNHGTHVTGIIAAENNKKGIRGVSDTSKVVFASAGRFDAKEPKDRNRDGKILGTDFIEFTNTINSMIDSGAKVINMSWGETCYIDSNSYIRHLKKDYEKYKDSYTKEDWISAYGPLFWNYVTEYKGIDKFLLLPQVLEYKEEMYESYSKATELKNNNLAYFSILLIESLISKGNRDVLFVKGAGNGDAYEGEIGLDCTLDGTFASINEDTFNSYPKKHINNDPNLLSQIKNYFICVSGYSKEKPNVVDKGFNYGRGVDLVAPGREIYSTVTTEDGQNSEDTPQYGLMTGTSMAAPMVTGSAAVLWSIDPSMTNAEVKDLLIRTSREGKPGNNNDTVASYHMLNLDAAVNELTHKKKGNVSILVTDEEGKELTDYSIDMVTEYSDDPFFNYHRDKVDTNTITLPALGKCTITVKKDGYKEEKLELDVKPEENIPIANVVLKSTAEKWQEAYTDFLDYYTTDVQYAPGSEPRFILAHIDDDDIPELVILPPAQNNYHVEVYSMRDGKVVKLGDPNGTIGNFVYTPYMNMIRGGMSTRGGLLRWFMEINGNSISERARVESTFSYNGITETEKSTCYLDDSVVSTDEFNQFLSQYTPVVSVGFDEAYTRAFRNTDLIIHNPDALFFEDGAYNIESELIEDTDGETAPDVSAMTFDFIDIINSNSILSLTSDYGMESCTPWGVAATFGSGYSYCKDNFYVEYRILGSGKPQISVKNESNTGITVFGTSIGDSLNTLSDALQQNGYQILSESFLGENKALYIIWNSVDDYNEFIVSYDANNRITGWSWDDWSDRG